MGYTKSIIPDLTPCEILISENLLLCLISEADMKGDTLFLKTKDNKIKTKILAVLLICVAVGAGYILWVKLETEPPGVDLNLGSKFIGSSRTVEIKVEDFKSGLKHIRMSLFQNGLDTLLTDMEINKNGAETVKQKSFRISLEPSKLNLSEGSAVFRLAVTDRSWWRWFSGNRTYIEKEVVIDTRPPDIQLLSRRHNVAQGGSGVAFYRISESCVSGIEVGDLFFKGYPGRFTDQTIMTAFFALKHDHGTDVKLLVKAEDKAGNKSTLALPHYIRRKRFRNDSIRISDNFLNTKMPEFYNKVERDHSKSPLDYFLKINRDIRAQNYDNFRKIAEKSEPNQYWEGAFMRLHQSATMARFADKRDYIYNGNHIDTQIHMGVDLASTSHAPVNASNNGKVIFVGDIGIYGKTVVIDHGFGLLTTYSHLNGYEVTEGQIVSKNDIIGQTGVTGLAGGDHLHFGVLVQNIFVNPVEWWDGEWIKNNINDKIDMIEADYSGGSTYSFLDN